MNIAVCDDEPVILSDMSERIEKFFREYHRQSGDMGGDGGSFAGECRIKCCQSGGELTAAVRETPFDIIFLDIQMEGRDGMETARILRDSGFEGTIIFVTVLPELVYDSFAVGAGDYLVKPVSDRRLNEVLERTVKKQLRRRLVVRREGERVVIPFDDILYCEVMDKETVIHTLNEDIPFRGSLGSICERLDGRFILCHRSFLVNLGQIERVSDSEVTVRGGKKIPLSRLRRQRLVAALTDFMGECL